MSINRYPEPLSTARSFHFVGIGGSGMCPMAELLHDMGYTVTGSDRSESESIERDRRHHIPVYIGQRAENVGDVDVVVYSAAVKPDNPELAAARERGIPAFERSVVLGWIASRFANCLAVSGTHGKTTTVGMLTTIFLTAGRDPSAIIGGRLPLLDDNGHLGSSENIVVEACEYVDTFLQVFPSTAVITNIDDDHLDYFGNVQNTIRSFHQYASQTSKRVVVNRENANAMQAVEGVKGPEIVTFGLDRAADYWAGDLNEEDTVCEDFTLYHHDTPLCRINLTVPGEHNMMNALAAAAAAAEEGIDPAVIKEALETFSGVHRRFEIRGKFEGVTVADDFAHHPTELSAVLASAVRMGYREVWAVFQPHTYSRTAALLDDFARVLSIPHHVVMTEILAVREQNTYNIHTSDLAAKIPGSRWFGSFEEIADYVMANARPNDLILTLGGGDIYKCANLIVEKYRARA